MVFVAEGEVEWILEVGSWLKLVSILVGQCGRGSQHTGSCADWIVSVLRVECTGLHFRFCSHGGHCLMRPLKGRSRVKREGKRERN